MSPGLADATFREVRVGLRPVSDDDLPILGALPDAPNVHVATGHGANGLLLGPLSGRLVADAIVGRAPRSTSRRSHRRASRLARDRPAARTPGSSTRAS